MDTARIREITLKIEELQQELRSIVGSAPQKKPVKCSVCGGENHTARNCDAKHPASLMNGAEHSHEV